MRAAEIVPGVYWVGVLDWDIRYFHGRAYSTHRGTTYNAYLIKDEKTVLVDTVYGPFAGELLENLRNLIDPAGIDCVVVNHIETDHAGALPEVMRVAPRAKIYCTRQAAEGLRRQYGSAWEINEVKTGDRLSIGRRSLVFIPAPMLHWPDSMFTYVPEDELLLPNDAFGQHYATNFRFDDQVDQAALMEEAAKYYANILYPFSALVLKKLAEIRELGLKIKVIAPSHGVVWRGAPDRIMTAYARWAGGEAEPRVLVVYDTMWESTARLARAIVTGVTETGCACCQYRIAVTDHSDVMKEVLLSRALVVGSPTINRGYLPTLAPFLDDLVGLKPAKRAGAAFGSYGWSGEAVGEIEEKLKKAGVDLVAPGLKVKWVPGAEDLAAARELGRQVAARVMG
ncbi:MAG: flavodoxin domain-containing protein [Bacillota bacterium]